MADGKFLHCFADDEQPVLKDLIFTYEKENSTIFRSIIDRNLGKMYQGSEYCSVGVVDDTNTRLFHADVRAEPNYHRRTSVNLVSQLLYLKSM